MKAYYRIWEVEIDYFRGDEVLVHSTDWTFSGWVKMNEIRIEPE